MTAVASSPSALDAQDSCAEPHRADPLTVRADALGELLGLSRARISPEDLVDSTELLARIAERRRLSPDHTVVAIAGATGSGKSTLFNALVGAELSATGVRRPTTARPVSCAWQPERAAGLLDRLGIAPQDRHARYGLRRPGPALPPAALPAQGGPGPVPGVLDGSPRQARFSGPAGLPGAEAASGVDAASGTDDAFGRAGSSRVSGRPVGSAGQDGAAATNPLEVDGCPAAAGRAPDGPETLDEPAVEERGPAPDGAGAGGTRAGTREVRDEPGTEGLILIDLPDHDSAVGAHREQVDRLLHLVDVVVWVLDPEKYADATLHERYLRPLAGHADVTVLVLNQVDRLPGDSADLVLDDLRQLLDEDGLAVGEHGEAGALVLSASAATGQGVADLRAVLAQIAGERAAAARRLAADLDRTARTLHPLYVGEGGAGLTDAAREDFLDRLAEAVGAAAVGQAAEREWGRAAWDACGTPWSRLVGERDGRDGSSTSARTRLVSLKRRTRDGGPVRPGPSGGGAVPARAARPAPAETGPAVPVVSAASVMPASAGDTGGMWDTEGAAVASSVDGTSGVAAGGRDGGDRGDRAADGRAAGTGDALPAPRDAAPAASRPVVDEAVRGLAADAARGLPAPWARAVGDAARRGGQALPAALDAAALRARPGQPERPGWWSVAASAQWLLMALVLAGVVCLAALAAGSLTMPWWPPLAMAAVGALGGPLVSATCRLAARGPARRYGQAAERRLRDAAADCGRARVLEPVAAELMRYREVREQYAVVAGSAPAPGALRPRASVLF